MHTLKTTEFYTLKRVNLIIHELYLNFKNGGKSKPPNADNNLEAHFGVPQSVKTRPALYACEEFTRNHKR